MGDRRQAGRAVPPGGGRRGRDTRNPSPACAASWGRAAAATRSDPADHVANSRNIE